MRPSEIKHERINRMLWFHALVLSAMFAFLLSGCSVEKRRYTSGFHVEGLGHAAKRINTKQVKSETKINTETVTILTCDSSSNAISENPHHDIGTSHQPEISVNIHANEDKRQKTRKVSELKLIHVFTGDVIFQKTNSTLSEKNHAPKGRGGVHPDAFSSLICGIAAMGCLAGIFLTGATPLILFAAFLIAMVVLAFFATRLAKRAFKDMHYARDRFGGKAMAALGMLLGVLSIVAFLGLITIVVLGIAFVNLT